MKIIIIIIVKILVSILKSLKINRLEMNYLNWNERRRLDASHPQTDEESPLLQGGVLQPILKEMRLLAVLQMNQKFLEGSRHSQAF